MTHVAKIFGEKLHSQELQANKRTAEDRFNAGISTADLKIMNFVANRRPPNYVTQMTSPINVVQFSLVTPHKR
jgi:hypothetical protein